MPEIGQTVSHYRIIEKLGQGGMGEVFRARDARLERDVAVKVLPAHLAEDPSALARFEREAKAIAALSHPNILGIFDVGSEGGLAYQVTELLEGVTLRAQLADGALPVRKAVDYAAQTAQGLTAAHEKGITHRDLKPENLFVTAEGRVKILDFGLAKQVQPASVANASDSPTMGTLTDPGIVMGTVAYMAPEQARGQAVDHRADLFSFGAVLYEMLTGRPAFRRDTATDTMVAILKEEPSELATLGPKIPPALARLVQHCLEKNPAARYQSARDLAFALQEVASGETTSGAGVIAAPRRRWPRSATRALAVLALVAAAALGALAYRRFVPVRTMLPEFTLKTFDRQAIFNARFMPDGQTIVYSAARTGNVPSLFEIRPDTLDARPFGPPRTHLLSVSSKGELAVLVGARFLGERLFAGQLATMSLEGAPKPEMDQVREADWSPDGTMLAIVRDMGTSDQLEYPIGKILYQTSGYVSDPRVSPDGARVAFMDHNLRWDNRGRVKVVTLNGQVTELTPEFLGEEGLAWSGDSEVIFGAVEITAGDIAQARRCGYRIHAVPAAAGGESRVALAAPINLKIFDTARDGRWLAVREDERWMVVAKVPGQAAERDLTWLDMSWNPHLSVDGRRLMFTDGRYGQNYGVVWREIDGGQPVRLGDGDAMGFSRDGKWALGLIQSPPQLVLYPTGAGETVRLTISPLDRIQGVGWFPDSSSILILGSEPSKPLRLYRQELGGDPPKPIFHESVIPNPNLPWNIGNAISPNGKNILAVDATRTWQMYPVDGASPRAVRGLSPWDFILGWTPDGRSVYVSESAQAVPFQVELIDLVTGRREPFREFGPADRAGLISIMVTSLSGTGDQYAYGYRQRPSALFIVSARK